MDSPFKTVAFLVSSNGGNLKFFHQAMKLGALNNIRLIAIADRPCSAIDYAERHQIDHRVVSYKRSSPEELQNALEIDKPDIVVTTWHKIIDPETIRKYPGKMINLHYSLLPAYGGLIGIEPIEKAYEQGCKFIGPTCHLVNEQVDAGPILSQAIFTTDRPLEEAIPLMFQQGCLILLNTVKLLMNEHSEFLPTTDGELFAPVLTFNKKMFDETFWGKLVEA